MKFTLLASLFTVLSVHAACAQNMVNQESTASAYRIHADGTSSYIGKCQTHENYENIHFKNTALLIPFTSTAGLAPSETKKLISTVGFNLFRFMLSLYDSEISGASTLSQIVKEFPSFSEYFDVHQIQTTNGKIYSQFNMGYDDGSGGYLVVEEEADHSFKQISQTGDGQLLYCDASVWESN